MIPHIQGRGIIGDISPVCEFSVVPLAGGTAHPTLVVADEVQKRQMSGITMFGKPWRGVPQQEGGGVPLLTGGVDQLRHAFRCLRGCRIHGVNEVRFQNCLVFPRKQVSLRVGEISTVCANCRHQNVQAPEAGHGEGLRGVSKPI